MPIAPIQVPSIILPTVWVAGTELETVNNLVEHTSLEVLVESLQEKVFSIIATEVITAGMPGNLWAWIELSPYPSVAAVAGLPASTAYWAAIGGGGGAIAPVAPLIVVATGVTLTVHSFMLPWAIHSAYARLVVQTPVSATPATAFWVVQAQISGKY